MSTVHQFPGRSHAVPAQSWTMRVDFDRRDGETRATAHLAPGDRHELSATGIAYLEPGGHHLSEAGDELAAAMALSKLAHFLMEAAANDVGEYHRDPGSFER